MEGHAADRVPGHRDTLRRDDGSSLAPGPPVTPPSATAPGSRDHVEQPRRSIVDEAPVRAVPVRGDPGPPTKVT